MLRVVNYLVLLCAFQTVQGYIEKVDVSGTESDMIMLTCRHLDSIIAVLEATFVSSNNDTNVKPTVFLPFHPRLALNKRCSGVMHCSFILKNDCPGADKWGEGIIYVKYACISANRVNKYCNQNITLGSQGNSLGVTEGFIHNPGYPRFYLGHPDSCRWKIKAPQSLRVKITILDLSIIGPPTEEDPCQDVLEIKESDHVIYASCSQQQPPMEILSEGETLEVSFRSMETLVPTRGILFHYTLVGCPPPTLPDNVLIVRRTPNTLELSCYFNLVFSDTRERMKTLTCSGYSWNVKLPIFHCENSTQVLDNVIKVKYPIHIENMGDQEEGAVPAVIVPAIIIAFLFILNAIIVFFIFKRRKAALSSITEEEMQVVNARA